MSMKPRKLLINVRDCSEVPDVAFQATFKMPSHIYSLRYVLHGYNQGHL